MATAPKTETVKILNRLAGAVIYTAEVEAGLATDGLKLGAAVKIAVGVGAYLADANLAGAKYLLDCGTPHGWRIVVVRHNDGIRIAAGCRWLTFSAAVEHWRNRNDRALMPPLLAYIRAACAINGWPLDEDRLVEG